jgi:hypothetical protein
MFLYPRGFRYEKSFYLLDTVSHGCTYDDIAMLIYLDGETTTRWAFQTIDSRQMKQINESETL